ncbi:Uncharacterized protein HZ326_29049, partial [Fusarium oxysporum f. sp. albedinis]
MPRFSANHFSPETSYHLIFLKQLSVICFHRLPRFNCRYFPSHPTLRFRLSLLLCPPPPPSDVFLQSILTHPPTPGLQLKSCPLL